MIKYTAYKSRLSDFVQKISGNTRDFMDSVVAATETALRIQLQVTN